MLKTFKEVEEEILRLGEIKCKIMEEYDTERKKPFWSRRRDRTSV